VIEHLHRRNHTRYFLFINDAKERARAAALQSRVVMQMGQQKFECIETITRREPEDLHEIPKGSVVHFEREIVGEGMFSITRDRLTEVGPNTMWVSENEYRFNGLMMRLIGLLSPAFRKQSLQHMQDFKALAEQGKEVRDVKAQFVIGQQREYANLTDHTVTSRIAPSLNSAFYFSSQA
jgi:hypothetical protein